MQLRALLIEYNPEIEIGKYYAFLHRGRLHVGQAIINPNKGRSAYGWVMKDLNDKKIYFPYTQEVFEINAKALDSIACITIDKKGWKEKTQIINWKNYDKVHRQSRCSGGDRKAKERLLLW